MELEFDKEFDAILRKARAPVGAAVAAPKRAHLDADAVAAFAENALPDKAKHLYMEHFADCDGCRKLLSNAILSNSEAGATAASHTVSAPVEAAVPWYLKIFRTPNLALAMGALVLTFGGVLGFLAFQNYKNQAGVSTAQVSEPERAKDAPYYSSQSAVNTVNANAAATNLAANAANISTATAPAMPSSISNNVSNPGSFGRTDSAPGSPAQPEKEKTAATGGAMPDAAKPAAAPPPPVDQPVASRDERKAGDERLKDDIDTKTLAMSKAESDRDRMAREAPMAKKTGPNRASGPRQNNTQQEMNAQQNQSVTGMVAPTTTVGGKTFENRNGAWYDTAYYGQTTKNYRRGTDEYKKLDRGLRSIADSIGGTVVVVWKTKAYLIN